MSYARLRIKIAREGGGALAIMDYSIRGGSARKGYPFQAGGKKGRDFTN